MKHPIFLLWLILFPNLAIGQQLTTQAAVNSFAGNGSGLNMVIGSNTCCSDIYDLSPLNELQLISGTLKIQNCPLLKDLTGLGNLKLMTGGSYFEIINCDSLTDLSGMGAYLDDINGYGVPILIDGCENIKSIHGIPGATSRNVWIKNCANFETIDMENFSGGLSWLSVRDCPKFKNLKGARFAKSADIISIKNAPIFESFEGCQGMEKLVSVELDSCHEIQNFKGLEILKGLNSLKLNNCKKIESLAGLDSLKSTGYNFQYMHFIDCPKMTDFKGISDSTIKIRDFDYIINKPLDTSIVLKNMQYLNAYDMNIRAYTQPGIRGIENMPRCAYEPYDSLFNNYASFYLESADLEFVRNPPAFGADTVGGYYLGSKGKLTDISGMSSIKRYEQSLTLWDFALTSLSPLKNTEFMGRLGLFYSLYPISLEPLNDADTIKIFDLYKSKIYNLGTIENRKGVEKFAFWNDSTITKEELKKLKNFEVTRIIQLIYLYNIDTLDVFKTTKLLKLPYNEIWIAMPNLKVISGFDNLEKIPNGTILIRNCDKLTTINGFKKLKELGDFSLYNNNSLTNATGFCKLFKEGKVTQNIKIENQYINSIEDITAGCDSVFVAIDEPDIDPTQLMLFPNPTNEILHIRLPEIQSESDDFEIKIFDAVGNLIIDRYFNGIETQVNIEGQLPGIYFVQYYKNNGS
jgi:hypothetical protein